MSLTKDVMEKIEQIAAGACERENLLFYDFDWISGSKGHGRTLRVYVDKDGEMPSVGDCERVSRGLSLILDVEDVIPGGDYNLEVSTPGLERNLRKPEHFKKAVGKVVQLRTNESINDFNPQVQNTMKRMKAKGVLKRVEEFDLFLDVDNVELKIPSSIVEKAHVVFDFDAEKGQKKSK